METKQADLINSICNRIYFEILTFQRFNNGKKPKYLVLVDQKAKDDFYKDIYSFTMLRPDLNFHNVKNFFGVDILDENVLPYGGNCEYILIGDKK